MGFAQLHVFQLRQCVTQVTCRGSRLLTPFCSKSIGLWFFFLMIFLFWPFYGFIDRPVEELTGNMMRERGSDTQLRLGVEPGSAAVRTKLLYMGRLL